MRHVPADNIRKGIAYLLLSTLTSAGMNAGMKWVSAGYPATEIVFFRQVFALIPIAVLVAFHGGIRVLRTDRLWGHLVRGMVGNASLACLIFAYKFLPLSDVTSYYFTTPLFLTALAVPLLKEKVGVHRWAAVGVGFCGVLIMMNPGHTVNFGAVLSIVAAIFAAFAMITVRHLSRTEHPLAIVFYFTMLGGVFTGLLSLFSFRMPAGGDWAIMIAIGLFGGITQYSLTKAYGYAQPSILAPYNYLSLVWSIGLQYLIWNSLPKFATIVGAGIIILSGLYIIYREVRKNVVVTTDPPLMEAMD